MAARDRLPTAHLAVWLTMGVALLSVATGIAHIGSEQFVGPLAPYVPDFVQRTAGFTGSLTGFLMAVTALGMRRRLEPAWYATVVLLPVTALQGLLQATYFSVPLVILSVLAMPTVIHARPRFQRRLSLDAAQLAAATALAAVLGYGTVGSYALREEYSGLDTMGDAFYYTVVTATTVGYGDVTPETATARMFGTTVVVLGAASFAVALGALLGPIIEARLAAALGRMTDRQLDLLEEHVIVLGYGELTEPILEHLDGTISFVVLTSDQNRAAQLRERDVTVLAADPSDEASQQRARIDEARAAVVATNDDARDALAVLTARHLAPELHIVAAATERENVDKLRRAGADAVISPAVIGGHLLAESALGGEDAERVADELVGIEGPPPE